MKRVHFSRRSALAGIHIAAINPFSRSRVGGLQILDDDRLLGALSELAAPVDLEDLRLAEARQGFLERLQAEACVHLVRSQAVLSLRLPPASLARPFDATRRSRRLSEFDLLRQRQRIVGLDPEVTDGARPQQRHPAG